MAVSLKDLIDITLLDYYDEKVKEWVVSTLDNKTAGMELTTNAELPIEGEIGRLYITENALLVWDDTNKKYNSIGGTSDESSWEEM